MELRPGLAHGLGAHYHGDPVGNHGAGAWWG
jgi:hypothetical protein